MEYSAGMVSFHIIWIKHLLPKCGKSLLNKIYIRFEQKIDANVLLVLSIKD